MEDKHIEVDFYSFVDFTGEENEKEFLEKCLEQWEITNGREISDINKLIELGTIFSEMRHRVYELD
jgi:hypothetical protein